MMTKQFFDVFPTLKVNSDCKVLFENVEVTKVTTNSDRDYLHVHLFSTHLLAKSWIYKMETMIKEQLFGRNRIRIRIYEDYQLSGQYTPENLMNEYRESILLELKDVYKRQPLSGSRQGDGGRLRTEYTCVFKDILSGSV